MRYTPLATDALCPMPYALCPMPARAPRVTEKGYISSPKNVTLKNIPTIMQSVIPNFLIENRKSKIENGIIPSPTRA